MSIHNTHMYHINSWTMLTPPYITKIYTTFTNNVNEFVHHNDSHKFYQYFLVQFNPQQSKLSLIQEQPERNNWTRSERNNWAMLENKIE